MYVLQQSQYEFITFHSIQMLTLTKLLTFMLNLGFFNNEKQNKQKRQKTPKVSGCGSAQGPGSSHEEIWDLRRCFCFTSFYIFLYRHIVSCRALEHHMNHISNKYVK